METIHQKKPSRWPLGPSEGPRAAGQKKPSKWLVGPSEGPHTMGFSFSSISTFKSCPRAYQYKYIDQLSEAFSSIETYMGSCVHETLEWAYTQRKEGYEPTLEMALEQYKYTWNRGNFETIKIVKEDKTRGDYYTQGGEFLVSFFQRVFPYDQSTTLYLEHQFDIPLGDEIIYRGVIDRIAREPDGTLRITDYKTGRVGHPLDTLQLPSYALYIFRHNIDHQIRLCIEDLREQRTVTVLYSRKEAKNVKAELWKDIQQIRNTRGDDFFTNPSILCLWCGYNQVCDNPHESVRRVGKPGMITQITHGSQSPKENSKKENRAGELPEVCPLCGSPLRRRNGKFGPFWGCSDFPQCRYTRNIVE